MLIIIYITLLCYLFYIESMIIVFIIIKYFRDFSWISNKKYIITHLYIETHPYKENEKLILSEPEYRAHNRLMF